MDPSISESLISDVHAQCFDSFVALINAINNPIRDFRDQTPFILKDVRNSFDKYKTWAGNVGAACAGKRHQISLDYRLREASIYKIQVLKLIGTLNNTVQKVLSLVQGARRPFEELSSSDPDSQSNTAASSEDDFDKQDETDDSPWEISASSDDDDESHPKRQPKFLTKGDEFPTTEVKPARSQQADHAKLLYQKPTSEMPNLLESIDFVVNCLCKIPIRRPAPLDRLNPKASVEASYYQPFDILHIKDKFPYLDSSAATRLGKMITLRRQLLLYRRSHDKKLNPTEVRRTDTRVVSPSIRQSLLEDSNSGPDIMGHGSVGEVAQSHVPSTQHTPETYATIVDHKPVQFKNTRSLWASSTAESKSSLASSYAGETLRVEVPPLPKGDDGKGHGSFKCPYCRINQYIKDRHAWKKHVLGDLQPYVCTYPDCQLSDRFFESRAEWYEHEINWHRMDWFCNVDTHRPYAEQTDFLNHMKSDHNTTFDAGRSSLWSSMFRYPSRSSGGICNLCGRDSKRLKSHVSRHLEQIALFALPRLNEVAEGETANAKDSIEEECSQHKEPNHSDSQSEHSSATSIRDHKIEVPEDAIFYQDIIPDSGDPSWDRIPDKFCEPLKILAWISATCHEENHFHARQERTSGTGAWLLRHKKYREWRASISSTILWLHGNAGTGKTKLVTTVIDDLLKTFEKLQNNEALAYFYCDRNQPDRQEPTLILSSFVRQLSTSPNSNAIPRSTVKMYNQKQQTGFSSGRLKLEESQTVLADLFQIFPQTTLVVDALDECDRKTRLQFIDILDQLIVESSKPVKILISSRRDRDIKHRFEHGPNLEIRAIDNRADIAMFVNDEIERSWQDEISFELKELILNTLVEKSEGIFRWVALQIDALRELASESDIRNELEKLPKTLKQGYDEIYHKIQSQEESIPMIANRAFQWVMCSCRPLSPADLVAAVCQDPDTDEIDEIDINIDFVLGACKNLLVVDQELDVCRFSHFSVQEYLESHHWNSCEADSLVGKICLSLLISNSAIPKQDTKPTKMEGRDDSAHDLFEYAYLNWATHLQRLEEKEIVENRLTALLKRFLGSMDLSSLEYRNWHGIVETHFDSGRSSYLTLPLYQVFHQLSPCSRASLAIVTFGFHKALFDWWTVGFADINQENTSGDSLLSLGALSGSVPIVENLLKQGADINVTSGRYGSALQAASYSGHESVVKRLLDRGADINSQGGDYANALQAASHSGHELVVQLLLDKGADVNASSGYFGSALQAASFFGYKSVVQLLLYRGADINALGGKYSSALQAASFSGHESVVQLLLDRGADIGGEYGNALQAASFSGHESVVQLLLDKGADVNASSGYFGSALQAASFSGYKSVVQLLLYRGADINALGGNHGSALQAASFSGHESVVQLLLDKGADVNASSGYFGSALQVASSKGSESILQMLLERGADINALGGNHGSALQAASFSGYKSVVQLLLDKGAEVNATGGRYGSALQAAAFSGDESVVQLLLDRGADINATSGEHGSALDIASARGHKAVVQLLQAAMNIDRRSSSTL